MRFMVFGAGALGSVVAARLADVHPVTLVGRQAHVAAIRAQIESTLKQFRTVRSIAISVEGNSMEALQP